MILCPVLFMYCKKCGCTININKYNKLQSELDELLLDLWKLLKKNNVK